MSAARNARTAQNVEWIPLDKQVFPIEVHEVLMLGTSFAMYEPASKARLTEGLLRLFPLASIKPEHPNRTRLNESRHELKKVEQKIKSSEDILVPKNWMKLWKEVIGLAKNIHGDIKELLIEFSSIHPNKFPAVRKVEYHYLQNYIKRNKDLVLRMFTAEYMIGSTRNATDATVNFEIETLLQRIYGIDYSTILAVSAVTNQLPKLPYGTKVIYCDMLKSIVDQQEANSTKHVKWA